MTIERDTYILECERCRGRLEITEDHGVNAPTPWAQEEPQLIAAGWRRDYDTLKPFCANCIEMLGREFRAA